MRAQGRLSAGIVMLVIGCATKAQGQDSNYWSAAYGARAQLLGGVVVGSPGDISSTYYNPGALALSASSDFLLAGASFQYQRISLTSGAGPHHDLATSTLGVVPSMLAGEIPAFKHDRLAYSYLTHQSVDLDMEKRLTTGADSESPLPNATFAAFELLYHQSVNDNWYGLTWSHQLSSRLGFGVTPELAVRYQRTSGLLFAMGENAGGQQAVLTYGRDFDLSTWRLLARFGLSGVRDSLTYGFTLTTPGLGLFGSGSFHETVNLTDETGRVGDIIGASYQDGLSARYQSPLGAGAGASYGWGTWRVHTALEWWSKVDRYNLIEGTSFMIQTPNGDSLVTAIVSDQLDAVFNYGLGLEKHFGGSIVGFASYHTDRTGRPANSVPGASVTSWNLTHVTLGATFNAWHSNFAIGQSAAFGSRPVGAFAARPDGVPDAELQTHALILTGIVGWKVSF